MELIFLGTGAGVPSKNRNVTSMALSMLNERNAIWLFDAGEGTQHQILNSPIKLSKLEKIFITHMHGDHIFGLPGLLSSRSFQGGESLVTIYGPLGIKEYLETALSLSGTHLTYPLKIIEIKAGVICADEQFEVRCLELKHGLPSFGFRIIEKDKPGELKASQLLAEGVKPGPIFKKLKNGEIITLEDGRILDGRDYIGPAQPGRIIAIFGDTRPTKNAAELAQDADLLVHEATFSTDKSELAYEYMHSTTKQAAELALVAGVKRLILTHISSRYDKSASEELLKEAQSVFSNTELASDFAIFKIGEREK